MLVWIQKLFCSIIYIALTTKCKKENKKTKNIKYRNCKSFLFSCLQFLTHLRLLALFQLTLNETKACYQYQAHLRKR